MDVENKFSELVKKLLNKEQNQQEKERYMRKQFIPTTSDPTVMTKEGLENILDNITVNEKKLQQTFKNRDKATRRSRMTQIEYEKQMKLLNDEKEKALYDIKNYKKLSDKKKTEIQEKLLKSLKKLDVVRRTYLTKSLNEAIKQGIKLNDDYIDTISNITIQRYPLTLEQFKLYMQLNPYTTDEEQHNRNNEFNKYAENIIKTKKFKKNTEEIKDMEKVEKPNEKVEKPNEKVSKPKEKKKLNVYKRSFKDVNIRNHLNDLTIKQLKNIARASNLHTRIKLSSPRTVLIEAIAQLYEHENGKYKSKPFELKL